MTNDMSGETSSQTRRHVPFRDSSLTDAMSTYNGLILDQGGAIHNVKAYGASGNGVTDDTAFIQAAINAAEAMGGTVYFPPGKYRYTSTLTINSNGITLMGASRSLLRCRRTFQLETRSSSLAVVPQSPVFRSAHRRKGPPVTVSISWVGIFNV